MYKLTKKFYSSYQLTKIEEKEFNHLIPYFFISPIFFGNEKFSKQTTKLWEMSCFHLRHIIEKTINIRQEKNSFSLQNQKEYNQKLKINGIINFSSKQMEDICLSFVQWPIENLFREKINTIIPDFLPFLYGGRVAMNQDKDINDAWVVYCFYVEQALYQASKLYKGEPTITFNI